MINNNRFSADDDNVRSERLVLLSSNIDTFAGDLDYVGARLTWAQNASGIWEAARTVDEEKESHRLTFSRFSILFSCATRIHDLN